MKFTNKHLIQAYFTLLIFLLINKSIQISNIENTDVTSNRINSLNIHNNQESDSQTTLVENFIEKPNCGGCNCDNINNKRPIPLNSRPTALKRAPVQSITDFPMTATLSWANDTEDLDIHLKNDKGVDFPRDWKHVTEFNKKVRRFEANGGSSIKLEVLQIRSVLPKGRYLLYIYNCSNEKPMIFSQAFLRIFVDTYQLTKNGRRRYRKLLYSLKISNNVFNINDRVWRIGFIESDGKGKMLFKKIDKVSKNRAVFFDGLLEKEENKPVVINPIRDIIRMPETFTKKHGQDFCRTQCISNYNGKKKKCFQRGVKDCRACKYKNYFVKNQESRELNSLCKNACNLITGETTCKYYPYIDINLKIFNKHLISKHMIRKFKRHVYRLLGK